MKKTLVNPVFFLILMTSVFVCSSCETGEDVLEADLIGTWDIGQASVDIRVGGISIVQFLKTALQMSDQEAQDYVDELIAEFDYISGGTITFNADYSYLMLNVDLEEHGSWELDGNKLYLTNTGEILDNKPITVERLNSSSAFFVFEEDQDVDMDEDGSADFTATINIELNLSKQ